MTWCSTLNTTEKWFIFQILNKKIHFVLIERKQDYKKRLKKVLKISNPLKCLLKCNMVTHLFVIMILFWLGRYINFLLKWTNTPASNLKYLYPWLMLNLNVINNRQLHDGMRYSDWHDISRVMRERLLISAILRLLL